MWSLHRWYQQSCMLKFFSEQILNFSFQVYLVTGGYFTVSGNKKLHVLDSTEVLIKDAISWNVITNLLPQPMANFGIISFQNKIFIIGIRDDNIFYKFQVKVQLHIENSLLSVSLQHFCLGAHTWGQKRKCFSGALQWMDFFF